MSSKSKVSKLRISRRIPNMATFTAINDDGFKSTIEVVLYGMERPKLEFGRRSWSATPVTVTIDPKRAVIGNWVYAIVQTGTIGQNWDDSVLHLIDELKLWVGEMQGKHCI